MLSFDVQARGTTEVEESYLEGERRGLGVEADEGGARRVALQEAGAEPLRVALGDESALVGRDGQDLSRLEGLQLGRRAGGTVDLQLVAALVDGVQRHRVQHRVQDLWQGRAGIALVDVFGILLQLMSDLC